MAADGVFTSVVIDGLQWKHVTDITEDVRGDRNLANLKVPKPLNTSTSLLDFFFILFPTEILTTAVAAMNHSPELRSNPVSENELLKFFGLLVAMTQNPQGKRGDYWTLVHEAINPPPSYGRFIERQRFETIFRNLKLRECTEEEFKVQ